MNRKKWQQSAPTNESLKKGYDNRGKYPDNDNRKSIFNELGSKKIWKVQDKSHKVRLCPVHPDDNINYYGMTIYVHTNVGVNNDQFLCLKKMKSQKCPICEQQTILWDTEPEMAKDLYPQTRYLVWVVDLSVEKEKQVPLIWSCPKTAMDDILGISYKKATDEILNLANIDDGIPIYFDREKKGGTNFSQYKNFQLDDKLMPIPDIWLDLICSFEEVLNFASFDEIKASFLGTEVSLKEDVSTTVETPKFDEAVTKVEAQIISTSETISIDDMDRDQLEIKANELLSEDFEENEIEEMGIKKLRRLIKEKIQITVETGKNELENDPRAVLRRKLQERVK